MPDDKIQKTVDTDIVLSKEMLDGPVGGETLDSSNMVIPYVELTQSQSSSVTRPDNPIKPGVWHNSMTDESYGKEISVVVLDAIAGYRLLELDPLTGKKKLIAQRWKSEKVQSWNPELITKEMIDSRVFKKGQPNLLGDAFRYHVVVNGKDLAQITLKSTACPEARKLNTLLITKKVIVDGVTRHMPFYVSQFKFSTKWVDKGPDNKYWAVVITPDGNTRPQLLNALYAQAKDLASKTVSASEPERVEDLSDEDTGSVEQGIKDAKAAGKGPKQPF